MFTKVYALPNWKVTEENWDKHVITKDQLAKAVADKNTIAIRLENEPYGVLDFDAHAGSTGIELYEELKAEYPEFFNNTRTVKTGNGGIHVYFNKCGRFNQNALKNRGEVDVFDGHSKRWVVTQWSEYKDGKPAKYEAVNDSPAADLPQALLDYLLAYKPTVMAGSRSLDMPAPKKPLSAEAHIYADTDGDWTREGTGRADRLYALVRKAYFKGVGSPANRMAKALWLAEQVLDKASLPIRNYDNLDGFWKNHGGLSQMLDTDIKAIESVMNEEEPKRPSSRFAKIRDVEWLSGEVLQPGKILGLVAFRKVGKTTLTLGHLVKGACQEGMPLVVISAETTLPEVVTNAVVHGYIDSDIYHYGDEVLEQDEWEALRKFVYEAPGLVEMVRRAVTLAEKPCVIVVENPETFVNAEYDNVRNIGNSSNLDPVGYKHLINKIQNDILIPGGHAMVWTTHSQGNDTNSNARGGAAGQERFRLLWQLAGQVPDVTAYNASNRTSTDDRYFVPMVQAVTDEVRRQVASLLGISPTHAEIPSYVLDELEVRDEDITVDSASVDDSIVGVPMQGGKLLKALGITYSGSNPAQRLRTLSRKLAGEGWDLRREDRLWVVSAIVPAEPRKLEDRDENT